MRMGTRTTPSRDSRLMMVIDTKPHIQTHAAKKQPTVVGKTGTQRYNYTILETLFDIDVLIWIKCGSQMTIKPLSLFPIFY